MLTVKIVTSIGALEAISAEWDQLAAARPIPEVFHTFAWLRAWWCGYGTAYEVFTPVVRDEHGRVVGILPLARQGDRLYALGHAESDHNDILVRPEDARAVFAVAMSALLRDVRWTSGVIENVSSRGLLREVADIPETEIVSAGSGWAAQGDAAYFRELARKKSLRQQRKKLEMMGVVTFRHLEGPGQIEAHLPRLQRQHLERWALRGIRSDVLNPANRSYYAAMPQWLTDNRLRVSVLEVAGRPVAYHLGFELNGRYIWYKPTFDVDWSEYGPGGVLLQCALQYCAERGIRELDFTVGDETYKDRFTNLKYKYSSIYLYRRPSVERYVVRARGYVKANHLTAFQRAKAGRAWFDRLRLVLGREGVFRVASKLVREAARTVYQSDEVVVFVRSAMDAARITNPANEPIAPHAVLRVFLNSDAGLDEIAVEPFRFSALADAVLQYEYLSPKRITAFRTRQASGDRGYMVRIDGKLAHIAWVGQRREILETPETGPQCRLPLPSEASVIYDCWTADEFRGKGIYPAVLCTLANQEADGGRVALVYSLRQNAASLSGIAKAGFREAARMKRTRLLVYEWRSAPRFVPGPDVRMESLNDPGAPLEAFACQADHCTNPATIPPGPNWTLPSEDRRSEER